VPAENFLTSVPRRPNRVARVWSRPLRVLSLFIIATLASCSDSNDPLILHPNVPLGTISGPVTSGSHGFPATLAVVDLDGAGYVEEEFFIEGNARAFDQAGDWAVDGMWSVNEISTADYKTRILVRRPVDPEAFSGVVLVEWFNVTSLVDIDVDFGFLSEEILREGHAWVGVSAQAAGLESIGGGPFGAGAVGLLTWDPDRYSSLHHPGDAYSYDIFSQVGATLWSAGDIDPLGGLQPELMLANGQSQSAIRMVTYVNAFHTNADVYDGFLIHNRPGVAAPLGDGFSNLLGQVRADIDTPVFQVVSETDLYELAGAEFSFPSVRQPDSNTVHTWELAGTAHADAHYLTGLNEQGSILYEGFFDLSVVIPLVNSAPQNLAMHAALNNLVLWVREGIAPPGASPLETADDMILRDENGNALGGLRLPHIEVPTALLSGENGIPFSGRTVPFDTATLDLLYPSAQDYVDAVSAAALSAVDARYLLPIDAATLVAEAEENPPVD
jgi:Alpha/beta hydrolase domain